MNIPNKMPKVGLVMTSFPYCVEAGDAVAKIERIMDDHHIRHLPVQENGVVVGIVSERDLHHAVHRNAAADAKERIKAREIMIGDPYVVPFHTSLGSVVATMAERQIGSAIVMRRGKLAGIFTAMDACRILSEYLTAFFPSGGSGAAA
jgi:acetoin utilization protein AcuB